VRVGLKTVAIGYAMMLGLAAGLPARAAPEQPADVLFEANHLRNVAPGTELIYGFKRTASDAKMLGPSYDDEIWMRIDGTEADGSKDVDLRIFSGDRAREIGALPGLNGNPVLVAFLDRAVLNMMQLAGGSTAYFKNRLRAAILEKAKIEKTTAEFGGKTLDVLKISISPFEGDPSAERMLGYDGASFEILVGEAVPGGLLSLKSHYQSPVPDAPTLDETIVLRSVKEPKP
jgi:hypothetical protein